VIGVDVRTIRGVLALFAASTLMVLTACAGDDLDGPAEDAEVTQADGTAAPTTPAVEDRIQDASIAPGDFSGEALAVFGREQVHAGYEEMSQFANEVTFDADLLPAENPAAADFEAVAARMTPRAAADLQNQVARARDGDAEAVEALEGISFWGLAGEGVSYHTDGPIVINHTISNPRVEVDHSTGAPRLGVTFDQAAQARILSDGEPTIVPMSKTITYWLVPSSSGERTWDIDGTRSSWRTEQWVPDTGTY
jgi:hypothetical protein